MPPKHNQHYRSDWEQMTDFKECSPLKTMRRKPIVIVKPIGSEEALLARHKTYKRAIEKSKLNKLDPLNTLELNLVAYFLA